MSVDMSQFHSVFFEESFEGLDDMETGLLDLNVGEPDVETINTIFRAAHSIKGGSGTFGFSEIAAFTHVMETLLDEMRSGQRMVCQQSIELLLQSVDCLREMLTATRDEADLDMERIQELQTGLENLLASANSEEQTSIENSASESSNEQKIKQWNIRFAPHENLFLTGNDPLRIIHELEQLGPISVTVDDAKLPDIDHYDYESCYLAWDIVLDGDIQQEKITEIFEWVEDECDLAYEKILDENSINQGAVNEAAQAEVKQESTSQTVQKKPVKTESKKKETKSAESTSIRVDINKIDTLINMVGELVITQSMLSQFGNDDNVEQVDYEKLKDGLALLERNTRELQENVLQIRMLPISFAFNRFPRLVRDLSNKLNKKIELKLSGESTELDKTVMEKIGDPLVHLVRNSLDHGIELPEKRVAAGKPETGTLHLNAFHEGGNIVIEISDDGAGLNKERILQKALDNGVIAEDEVLPDEKINELIFMPGFSTAKEVSDVSGRGVGMDVVRRNIKDLGGVVEVESEEGVGSVFRIRLPLTLAILDGQLIKVGQQIYIIPLVSIIESLQVHDKSLNSIPGKGDLYRLRDEYIPIIRLHEVFNIKTDVSNISDGLLVVIESEGYKAGLFVDELLAQQQVVIKSLEENYTKVDGISGATILGDGKVAMILDIPGTLNLSKYNKEDLKSVSVLHEAA